MARWLVIFVAVFGCVDKGPGPQGKQIEASYIRDHLVPSVPSGVTRLDVVLGGIVTYAGNRVDRTTIAPGGAVHLTSYWEVAFPPGPGWRVFAIVRGDPGTADFMYLPATDMELGHPPATWKAGEVIEDDADFVLRPDWKSHHATVYLGLIEAGAHGVGDRMAAIGPHVEDRAIVARTFDVDLSKAPPPPGTVYVPYAAGPIVIDGLGMDQGWSNAVTSPPFETAEGSAEPVGRATAKMTWDDHNLYLFVSVIDPDIVSQYTQHDQDIWKQDVIEVFIDADANRHGYVELQVSPGNVTFDKWWPMTRATPGDTTWDSGMVTAVKLHGTTKPDDTDEGWDAEIAIPWQAVKGGDPHMAVRLPPHVGDRWRMNVVRGDVRSGQTTAAAGGASSWNRITNADFHALDRMLTVVFADRNGSIVPGPQSAVPVVPVVPAGAGTGAAAGSGNGKPAAGTGSGSRSGGQGAGTGTGNGIGKPAAGTGSGNAIGKSAAGTGSGNRSERQGAAAGAGAGSAAVPVTREVFQGGSGSAARP